MMANDDIGFIGGGNMTHAIVAGLVAAGTDPGSILIAEPAAARRDELAATFPDARIASDNPAVAAAASCLVLAVKPQLLTVVCRELAATVQRSRPLIVSIAAGVRSDDIDAWLGGDLGIVRVMPNQPALLRRGISGMYANERVDARARVRARRIMAAVGRVVEVPKEADIDAITAVSGSGPAYFYLLMEMLEQSALEFGLEPETAHALAVETAVGAAELAAVSHETADALIGRVRSPGGTTAAALDSLDAAGVRDIFSRAITAARDRAVELADRAHEEN
jgi:pyrroline-5-carboxylate reductase